MSEQNFTISGLRADGAAYSACDEQDEQGENPFNDEQGENPFNASNQAGEY